MHLIPRINVPVIKLHSLDNCFFFSLKFHSSIIGNEDASSSYELHIGVKDYCFGRDDRLIGVSVMQLKDIQNQVRKTPLFVKNNKDKFLSLIHI